MAELREVGIRFETIVKTILFLIFLWVLFELRALLLVLLTAIVIASAIEPATRWFERYRVPRILAVIFLYAMFFGVIATIFTVLLPPLLLDLRDITQRFPEFLSVFDEADDVASSKFLGGAIQNTISINEILATLSERVTALQSNILKLFATIFGGVLSFVLIVVFSFYLSVQRNGIENLLGIITPFRHEAYVIDVWRRVQVKIGLWFRGQLLLALLIGILVYLSLTVFGIPYAGLLAVIAGIFELIPIFGPILAAVPAIGIGFLHGGAGTALLVLVLYVIIQQFENQLIYPLVVRQVVGVPPIIAIIALIAGAQLASILGVILSIPVAAFFMELLSDLDKEKHRLRNGMQGVA